jgi:hypothetical protein
MKWLSRVSEWADSFVKALESLTRAIRDATEAKQLRPEFSQRVSAENQAP